MSDAFWNGLWSGVFELIALGLIAGWINLIYQRIKSRQGLRRDLIDDIDSFSSSLYKPRKIYQHLLKQREQGLDPHDWENKRLVCLDEFTSAAGQFRALQVKMVPLYGFDVELFGYYLAVWNALRGIRKRIEKGEDLYEAHENEASSDALYRLLDQFRYRVQITPSVKEKPRLLNPSESVENEIFEYAKLVTQKYLSSSK